MGLSLALVSAAAVNFARGRAKLRQGISPPIQITIGAAAILDLNGLDATGAPVAIGDRNSLDALAIFVMRARSALQDCAYWNRIVEQIAHARAAIRPVAFCDTPGCESAACPAHQFPVISFAEIVVMERVALLNEDGSVLLVDAHGRALKRFRWRGKPESKILGEMLDRTDGS